MPSLISLLRRAFAQVVLPAGLFAVLAILATVDGPPALYGGKRADPCAAPCAVAPPSRAPALQAADIGLGLPAEQPTAPNDAGLQARLASCAVWTDRCITCTRAGDQVSCSNIGIACQPEVMECVKKQSD
jgi:hypothetical protein